MSQEAKDEFLLIGLVANKIFTWEQLETTVSLDDVFKVTAYLNYKSAMEARIAKENE